MKTKGITEEVKANAEPLGLKGLLMIYSRLYIPNICVASCLLQLTLIWYETQEPETWFKYRECREGCGVVTANG